MAGPHINHLSAWNLSEQEGENELARGLGGWEIAPEELSWRKGGRRGRRKGRNAAKSAEWEEEQADWGGEWRKWKEVYGDNEGRGAECKVDVKILWVEKGSEKCTAITGRHTGAWARGRQEEEEGERRNMGGHGLRLRTDGRGRHTQTKRKGIFQGRKKPGTTDTVTSTEGRDCKTKGNLRHFLVC